MTADPNKQLNPEQWLQKYGDDLYAWAYYRTRKPAVAEDLVQETLLSALSSIDTFRGGSSEKTWLFAILKNKITDHYRKAFVKYEMEESAVNPNPDGPDFPGSFFDSHGKWKKEQRPSDWHEEEDNLLDDDEFRKILEMCMKLLPKNWFALITLRFMEEKKTPEICKELNITASNLWVIMHRSKLQLRACIEEHFMD